MKAVILAAGAGSGINDLSRRVPKCLIEIGGKTLLERHLELLSECGIKKENIVVVIGGKGDVWNEENKEKIKKIHENIVINDENLQRGQSHSFLLGTINIDDDVLCMDGDLLFNKEVLERVIKSNYSSALLTSEEDGFKKGNKVLVKRGRVLGMGPNIISDKVYLGIAKFGKVFLGELRKEIESGNYFKGMLDAPIYKICVDNFIYNIDLENRDAEEMAFLNGGSHAITKEITVSGTTEKNLNTSKIVRKEATEGRDKLINEINWMLNLPPDVREHFPKIIRYDLKSDPVFVEMEKYPMKTLRRLLMDGEIGAKEALEILEKVLDFMFEKMYSKNVKPAPAGLTDSIYFSRIDDRLKEMKRKAKIFEKIVGAENIIINGKKLMNMQNYFSKLKKNDRFMKIINPPAVRLVHGDPHFDNILVDKNNYENFMLIDPRGKMYKGEVEGDYAYDLGKIWHCLNGLYDFLHEDKFNLDAKIENDTVYADFNIIQENALKEYRKMFSNIPGLLYKYDLIKNDPFWDIRTRFNEVVHFCSMPSFHMKGDDKEQRAIALYLRGIMLLDKFVDEWEFYPAEPTLINVNTPQDYLEAKRIFEEKK